MISNKIKMLLVSLIILSIYPAITWASLSKNQVSQLYVSIFGRASEGEGNQYWQAGNWDMATTANKMLDTKAAKDYFGNSLDTDQAFIEHIYKNTLNKTRAVDPDGIAYWVGQLKTQSKGQVVSKMVDTILQYGPGQPYYSPNDIKATQAYEQFYNRVEVSNYMADTVYNTPDNWEVVTAFSRGLKVTYDKKTLTIAFGRVEELGDGTSPPEGSALEQKIKEKMKRLTSMADQSPMGDMSSAKDEIKAIFGAVSTAAMSGDSSIVKITPPISTLQEMENIPSEMNIVFDFGQGYTPPETNSVYTGSGSIKIDNIKVSPETYTGSARMTLDANGVRRDGMPALNGSASLDLQVENSGIFINMAYNNLKSLQYVFNGGLDFSIRTSVPIMQLVQQAMQGEKDMSGLQSIVLQFNELQTEGMQVSGSITLAPKGEKTYEANCELSTPNGAIAGILRIQRMADNSVMLSTPSGPFHVEDLDITIPSLILDNAGSTCENGIPARGDMTITDGHETRIIQFGNCAYTIQ